MKSWKGERERKQKFIIFIIRQSERVSDYSLIPEFLLLYERSLLS